MKRDLTGKSNLTTTAMPVVLRYFCGIVAEKQINSSTVTTIFQLKTFQIRAPAIYSA